MAKRNCENTYPRGRRKKRNKSAKRIIITLIVIILIAVLVCGAYAWYLKKCKPDTYDRYYDKITGFFRGDDKADGDDTYEHGTEELFQTSLYATGNLQIHFPELGNKYTGDCVYIKAGDTDILIDAGSRTGSISTIRDYLDGYVTDGKLEYVIVTHAHEDHYAGFATPNGVDSLFDIYECETIIDFALTNQSSTSKMYNNYLRERNDEISAGAVHYTASDCIQNGNDTFSLADGIEMKILDSYYYYNEATTENDYSVCVLISQGDRHFLFTGDLEEKGEKKLVEMNDLPNVVMYKAGHHGSKTSSSEELLSVIKPQIVCVCCVAGSSEYTKTAENQFPTQKFINNVSKYTSRVYVTSFSVDYTEGTFTSMNGCITIMSEADKIMLRFSSNNTRLKDTEWFKNNRTCPEAWR
ncbi:MAG: MBL fold metallo-hydrolase [Eubacteriales bacterium]|nr:MBL fold metallo-hydrolase [Eubacteriales bacterium]